MWLSNRFHGDTTYFPKCMNKGFCLTRAWQYLPCCWFPPLSISDRWHVQKEACIMMTSSNGIIFRVTGTLCGEFIGPGELLHKGQWRGALMFSLICVWINDWVNNREAGDLRRYRGHYDVIVMIQRPVAELLALTFVGCYLVRSYSYTQPHDITAEVFYYFPGPWWFDFSVTICDTIKQIMNMLIYHILILIWQCRK